MPKYRIRTTTEAEIEYHVEAESIADVVAKWNAGGEIWETLIGGGLDDYYLLELCGFSCLDEIDEDAVKELTPAMGSPR